MLKLLFVFVFIFETLDAGKFQAPEKHVSFSVGRVWQMYNKKDKCGQDDENKDADQEWIEGVQEYYDGCRTASWKFRGPSYEYADIIMKSFQDHLVKLIYFSNCNSTVLTPSSSSILHSLSRLNKLEKSGLIIIKEFNKALPALVREFNEVVRKLENTIGRCAIEFNEILEDFGYILSNFITEFLKSSASGTKCPKKINYVSVLKQHQKLMNIVAIIAETLLNECESVIREVEEAVMVFSLFYQYFTMAVQGVNSCVQDFMFEQECAMPKYTKSCSVSLEFVIVEITQAVSSVMFPFTESIEELLSVVVNITMAFNTALKDILGIFEGVPVTVEEIKQNVSMSVSNSNVGVPKKVNFLKGIRARCRS